MEGELTQVTEEAELELNPHVLGPGGGGTTEPQEWVGLQYLDLAVWDVGHACFRVCEHVHV